MGLTGDNRGGARRGSQKSSNAHNGRPFGAAADEEHSGTSSSPSSSSSSSSQTTTPYLHVDTGNTPSSAQKPAPNTSSRFGFLSAMSGLSRLTSSSTPLSKDDDDDRLLELDIEATLAPTDRSRDTFSPAAFKNFQMQAIGLLTQFQGAHRRRTAELRDLRAEREAREDEEEEAETRAQHLKIMLDNMARKVDEQEAEMRRLAEELAAEKRMRMEEHALEAMSEDLGVDEDLRRQAWRKSAGTTFSIDTDEESIEAASIFSHSRSPTVTPSIFEGATSPVPSTPSSRVTSLLAPKQQQQQQPPPPRSAPSQLNAFQKLLKGISGDNAAARDEVHGCSNCRGQAASMAWDTVGLLRDENRGLKQRVEELEGTVEGVLDLVNGVGA